MSHDSKFENISEREQATHAELLIYARRTIDDRDALSKLFADSKEKNADLVRSNLGLDAENTALREHISNLRRQLYEAQLEHRNDTVTVIKREGGLDYVLAVQRVDKVPGGLRVLLV